MKIDDLDFGWKSPISGVTEWTTEVVKAQEEFRDELIARAVVQLGIEVDRDELIKALLYDRRQYEKGFKDGYIYRGREIIRCGECEYYVKTGKFCSYDGRTKKNSRHVYGIPCDENWSCADGERRE